MKGIFFMKIITFAAIKGGVGKTTLAFNFGEYLARQKNQRVLMIDLDHQCNLTQTYGIYDTDGTIGRVFDQQGAVQIHDVNENVSLIAGDMHLDAIETSIENNTNKNMLLYMWLADQYEELDLGRFDYLILDTHPDFSTATKNAIAISHAVLSPITPSEHGYNAKFNLEERMDEYRHEAIDFATRKSYVTAQLLFIANMIKHNTKSSRDLLETLQGDASVIAEVPERELFNRSTLDKHSLAQMYQEQDSLTTSQRRFMNEIMQTFGSIKENIDAIK